MIKKVRTAARGLIQQGDRLLVVRYRDERGDWFVLPGGGQAHGETLIAAVERELAEEIGARVRVGRLCFVRECIAALDADSPFATDVHQVEHIFACELEEELGRQSLPDKDQIAVEWRTVAELKQLRFYPKALLEALDRLEFGYLGLV
jgi:ADP-ribose pyrophosphatase YjhB (NUDIX family)